jgi:hypothetical protein
MYYSPGALHMHTTFSDGSGSVEELARAARDAGLRWIIITDHDTLAGLPQAGWLHDVLVIVGHEITPDHNHFLALNVAEVVDRELGPQRFVDEVYARGGFGIIAHPDERVANAFKDIYRWDDWAIDGPSQRSGRTVGIELWNLMSDWGEHLTHRNKELLFFVPRLGLAGPTNETLAWWDQLNIAGKRTFGVGGVDAHAFKRRVPWGTAEIFPYRWIFGTLTNYLLLDAPLAPDARTATDQVYAALATGRSYFVNRLDGDCAELGFFCHTTPVGAHRAAPVAASCGDTVPLVGGVLTFEASVPLDAELHLIHNGRVLARSWRALRHTITEPGVYRLEGYRKGRPWLYANPVYVTP